VKALVRQTLLQALAAAQKSGQLPPVEAPDFVIERPKQAQHGDLATNLAMQLARPCRLNPRAVAEALIGHLGNGGGLIERAEIAGPGFINLFLKPSAWLAVLPQIMAQGHSYGPAPWGQGKKVLVEFVSANPTGPLHVGHGRGAVLGDVLARMLKFAGFAAHTEYYINDAGTQMATLGRSVLIRARQLKGSQEPFPDNHYRGEYIGDMAAAYFKTPEGAEILDLPEPEAVARASAWAGEEILNGIKDDLSEFGVELGNWYSETSLVQGGAVERAFADLKGRDLLYESEGALWFRANDFGDEKDRVVRRQTGELTYFASDIAYHLDKFKRGYGQLIDVWGADHHGYAPRLQAAMTALGRPADDLKVVLVQLVNLLRKGEPVAMSTRAGEFVTLREVVDEVGKDSARFIFLTRRAEAPLDFDLDLAKQKSLDNPVFYVQYAHTRVKSVLRKAAEKGVPLPDPDRVQLPLLALPVEVALARRLAEYPEMLEGAIRTLEPHRITYYLHDLAGEFHSYYNDNRILIEENPDLAAARLVLAQAVGIVLTGGLSVLGVSAPEVM